MIIDLAVEIPSLPAGWKGSPDDLFQFLVQNGVFHLDGNFPSGQIGGAKPTQDVGVWYGDTSIEKYINGKYRPISDVPIGATMAWASTAAVAPDNYLFCTGQSLSRVDFAELFAVIGVTYGTETSTTFNVPDYRGRVAVGAGVGDYIKQGTTGLMREVVAGQYSGFEWTRNIKKAAGAPKTTKVINGANYVANNPNLTETFPPRVGQQFLIRYR